jgi:hypothetical protein
VAEVDPLNPMSPAPAPASAAASGHVAPEAPAVERQIVFDMLRRGLPVLPLLVVLSGIGWGMAGALSSLFGLGIVLANFVLAALLLSWAARQSPSVLMGAALGGFLARMIVIATAVALVRHRSWVEIVPLGITVLVAHVGLLVWETRHVSASLAYPGLKPRRTGA